MHRLIVAVALLLQGRCALACPAGRPLQVLVPYAAGGALDSSTRVLTPHVGRALARPVVVVNVPGASGLIAVRRLLAAAPDGCTVLSASVNTVALLPLQNPHAGFDAAELRAAGRVGRSTLSLVTGAHSPYPTVEALRDAAQRGGVLRAGHPGVDSLQWLALRSIEQQWGTTFIPVPYSSGMQLVTDLAGGHLDLAVMVQPVVRPAIEQGRLRELKALRPGVDPGVITSWSGWFAADGVPDEWLDRLGATLARTTAEPAVVRQLAELGVQAAAGDEGDPRAAFQAEVDGTVTRLRALLPAAPGGSAAAPR